MVRAGLEHGQPTLQMAMLIIILYPHPTMQMEQSNVFSISLDTSRNVHVHAGYIGNGHDALLLRQIARDLLHALSHRHDYTWTAFGEPVVSTGGDMLRIC